MNKNLLEAIEKLSVEDRKELLNVLEISLKETVKREKQDNILKQIFDLQEGKKGAIKTEQRIMYDRKILDLQKELQTL